MADWKMTCTCGDVLEADGDTVDEAVDKVMTMMTPDALKAHMDEKHDGAEPPTPEQQRGMLMESATAA